MPAPMRWKSKLLTFKAEVTYGVDAAPTAVANAILARNVTISPMEGEDVSRELEFPYMGGQATIPAGLRTRTRFQVELQGSGTAGVAPAWGPVLRACAVREVIVEDTSVTYEPISTAQESATMYFWIENTLHKVLGCRGTATLRFNAQGIAIMEFDILGLYSDPTESPPAVPDYTKFEKPTLVTKVNTPTFTVNAVPLVMREFSLTFNNQVEPRLLVGREEIIIVDRNDAITCRVEAQPVTGFNPFVLARQQTTVDTELVHGTEAGRIVTLNIPTGQIGRMPDYENSQNVLEWNLPIMALPNQGNDQWSLVLT
ncbi:phage tail tube protein [Paradevosia shaoguanensis]|uniref:Phage tail tube protein n=1 Tax=Paradevosia shaoguanensis TaxID=1335043 RepID=A0AA41UCX8_9HYPH|nr:phage tail tube protein [Paradevosia shaoguanensis]MCF1744620.1 phage tail tube protein [Paradevosia shaoguanensis]MCI0129103.1 phage tail tube protein [Paradevosia shaoguanensis]